MWLINNGASRHMTGDRKNFSSMKEKETPHKVQLGDKNSYVVKGIGQATIKMELGNSIHLSNVLYVPGLKNNLVSISCLEEKGDRLAFVDGKVLVWYKYSKIENIRVIGICEGRLYVQNLSMFLWGEETMTIVYAQNRSPHRILKNMTHE
jgi:hypothetical protein